MCGTVVQKGAGYLVVGRFPKAASPAQCEESDPEHGQPTVVMNGVGPPYPESDDRDLLS